MALLTFALTVRRSRPTERAGNTAEPGITLLLAAFWVFSPIPWTSEVYLPVRLLRK